MTRIRQCAARSHNPQHYDNEHNDTHHSDTQHNDIQHYDTRQKMHIRDTQHNSTSAIMLNVNMLSVTFFYCYAECHYAECRGACHSPSTKIIISPLLPRLGQILDLFFKFNSIISKKAQMNKLLFAKPQIPIVNVVICG
jgi:hypothetical protein